VVVLVLNGNDGWCSLELPQFSVGLALVTHATCVVAWAYCGWGDGHSHQ
jgi:hypothetical protein